MNRSAAIDVHAHGVPSSVLDDIRQNGDRYGGMSVADTNQGPVVVMPGARRLRPFMKGVLGFQDRFAWMAKLGISLQMISPWVDLQGHELPPAAAERWVAALNDAMTLECSTSRRLMPIGTLPFGDSRATLRELERCSRQLGMRGVMVSTHPASISLTDPSLEDVWAAAEHMGTVVLLHPPTNGPSSGIPDSRDFGNLYGRAIDTTFAATRLILAGIFDRYPRLRVVLVHGGGFLPYQVGRLDRSYDINTIGERSLSRMHASDYLSRFYYDTCLMARASLRMLAELVGTTQIVMGSDCPFPLGDPDPIGTIRDAGFDGDTTNSILRSNSAALFGIEEPSNV